MSFARKSWLGPAAACTVHCLVCRRNPPLHSPEQVGWGRVGWEPDSGWVLGLAPVTGRDSQGFSGTLPCVGRSRRWCHPETSIGTLSVPKTSPRLDLLLLSWLLGHRTAHKRNERDQPITPGDFVAADYRLGVSREVPFSGRSIALFGLHPRSSWSLPELAPAPPPSCWIWI